MGDIFLLYILLTTFLLLLHHQLSTLQCIPYPTWPNSPDICDMWYMKNDIDMWYIWYICHKKPCSALPTQPDHPLLVRLFKDHWRWHRANCRKPQKAGGWKNTQHLSLTSQVFACTTRQNWIKIVWAALHNKQKLKLFWNLSTNGNTSKRAKMTILWIRMPHRAINQVNQSVIKVDI